MTSDMKPNFRERAASRQSLHCPIVYTDGLFCAGGVVENFAAVGIRVRGTQPVERGMKLVVFLLPPGHTTTLLIRRGIVRWINGATFGIDLAELSADSHAELSRLAVLHLPNLWSSLN
jgi:hypothetical protein